MNYYRLIFALKLFIRKDERVYLIGLGNSKSFSLIIINQIYRTVCMRNTTIMMDHFVIIFPARPGDLLPIVNDGNKKCICA